MSDALHRKRVKRRDAQYESAQFRATIISKPISIGASGQINTPPHCNTNSNDGAMSPKTH